MDNNTVKKTIKIFENEHLINGKVSEGLITVNSKTPGYYTNSKIHKQGITRRPAISSINCLLISSYNQYFEKFPLTHFFYKLRFFQLSLSVA